MVVLVVSAVPYLQAGCAPPLLALLHRDIQALVQGSAPLRAWTQDGDVRWGGEQTCERMEPGEPGGGVLGDGMFGEPYRRSGRAGVDVGGEAWVRRQACADWGRLAAVGGAGGTIG